MDDKSLKTIGETPDVRRVVHGHDAGFATRKRSPMDTTERIEIQRFMDKLAEFVTLHSDCTARQINAFLVVALNPGINVTELAKRCQVTIAC